MAVDVERYGRKWGLIFWRSNLTVAARFFSDPAHDARWELRWIGIAIPWTNWGFGFIYRRRLP